MFQLMSKLFNTLGYIIVIAFFFTKFSSAKKIFSDDKRDRKDIIMFSIFFSALSILGTYIGTDYKGAIVNSRNLGVVVGGILAGPEVAIISGFIAGIHRSFVNPSSITTIPCSIATILGGFVVSVLFYKVNNKNRAVLGLIGGVIVENLSMLFIFIAEKNTDLSLDIIKSIYLPMVLINGIGTFLIIILAEEILEKKDKEAGTQAKLALEIANKTLPYFRKGESLEKVCKILLDSLEAKVVVITDSANILASSAIHPNLEIKHKTIQSDATKEVLETGEVMIIDEIRSSKEWDCEKNEIQSGIIVPLFQGEKVFGTLKIYYSNTEHITAKKKYLAIGLSQLISTQLEISNIENFKIMARDAELKALQNQINPHFLFNSLHAIIAFLRFDPSKAREIIIDLSTYLRYNLENTAKVVPLEKELEQVRAYVNIEKSRFQGKFDIIYDVDIDLNEAKIPSLTIQPLVENSLKHGILKQGYHGVVKISAKKIERGYEISIEDNGVGIDSDIISNLDSEIEKKIGLKNVHNRLKFMYGKGLNIEQLEKGTKISFNILKEVAC